MIILAIDTSTDYLSLAIMRDGKIAGRFHRKCAMRHSSALVPMMDRLLKKARLRINDIDGFVLSIGPGSFTGLRIGAVTVKGLAYALKKSVVTVPTLDIIARNVKNFNGIICPVLDARKNKVYACLYKSYGKSIKRISKYLLLPASELLKKISKYDRVVLLGDMDDFNTFRNKPWHPKAEEAALIGTKSFRRMKFVKPEDIEPLYLYSRECDITGK